MTPETKENLKFVAYIVIGFLALKDIPVGELFNVVATSCGIGQ